MISLETRVSCQGCRNRYRVGGIVRTIEHGSFGELVVVHWPETLKEAFWRTYCYRCMSGCRRVPKGRMFTLIRVLSSFGVDFPQHLINLPLPPTTVTTEKVVQFVSSEAQTDRAYWSRHSKLRQLGKLKRRRSELERKLASERRQTWLLSLHERKRQQAEEESLERKRALVDPSRPFVLGQIEPADRGHCVAAGFQDGLLVTYPQPQNKVDFVRCHRLITANDPVQSNIPVRPVPTRPTIELAPFDEPGIMEFIKTDVPHICLSFALKQSFAEAVAEKAEIRALESNSEAQSFKLMADLAYERAGLLSQKRHDLVLAALLLEWLVPQFVAEDKKEQRLFSKPVVSTRPEISKR